MRRDERAGETLVAGAPDGDGPPQAAHKAAHNTRTSGSLITPPWTRWIRSGFRWTNSGRIGARGDPGRCSLPRPRGTRGAPRPPVAGGVRPAHEGRRGASPRAE